MVSTRLQPQERNEEDKQKWKTLAILAKATYSVEVKHIPVNHLSIGEAG